MSHTSHKLPPTSSEINKRNKSQQSVDNDSAQISQVSLEGRRLDITDTFLSSSPAALHSTVLGAANLRTRHSHLKDARTPAPPGQHVQRRHQVSSPPDVSRCSATPSRPTAALPRRWLGSWFLFRSHGEPALTSFGDTRPSRQHLCL